MRNIVAADGLYLVEVSYRKGCAVMSDEFNRDFADAAAAKAEIRAAVRYLLSGVSGSARGDIVREIIEIVRQLASGLPPRQSDPLDDDLPGG